jgi:hypothetical protein
MLTEKDDRGDTRRRAGPRPAAGPDIDSLTAYIRGEFVPMRDATVGS